MAVFGAPFSPATTDVKSERETRNETLSEFAATQGMVLLQNNDNALPVAAGETVALFGGGAVITIKGGGGSGEVNERVHDDIYEGLSDTYKISSGDWLKNFVDERARYEEEYAKHVEKYGTGWGAPEFKFTSDYIEASSGLLGSVFKAKDVAVTEDDVKNASATTGIYVISRYSTEGADWPADTPGYYDISETDLTNIALISKTYDKSVVILNTGGVINAKQLVDIKDLDAIFLMSQAGMRGGHALAQVLSGEVTPSGKTVDTWAAKYSDYPSAENFANNDGNTDEEEYKEGIFVGYRYFDTFGIDPIWEFGYGLSYTDFEITPNSVEADEEAVNVKVTVKNTGSRYSGKEVVQVYFSAPEEGVVKPYQELVAYGKTDELKPGQSEDLTISFKTSEMSSYSEEDAAYVMDKGDYIIRVGDSSRNTCVAAKLNLKETVITEQLSNLKFGVDDNNDVDDDIEKKDHNHIGYDEEAKEIEEAETIELDPGKLTKVDGNNASSYIDESVTAYLPSTTTMTDAAVPWDGIHKQDVKRVDVEGISKLKDVYDSSPEAIDDNLYKLIAQMSDEELGTIVEGNGMGGFSGAVGTDKIGDTYVNTPGAAGESTFKLYEKYGIPNTVLSDGPAGIRITREFEREGETYYQFATAFPIGTLIAQTWDEALITEIGAAVGEEMVEFGVTIWLAPALNIHRNPLCGRNFEYYSEDPFVSGITAAAMTNGVQSNPGVGVSLKHYFSNNQEDNRNQENNKVSERAIREIYIKGFEIAVKSAQPVTIMTCYNKINGTFGAGNYDSIMNAARGEWGYEGYVMTDWMSAEAPKNSMHAGNDMIQPGGDPSAVSDYLNNETAPTFANDGFVRVNYGWTGATYSWGTFDADKDGKTKFSTDVTVKWTADEKTALGAAPADDKLIEAALKSASVNRAVAGYVDDGSASVVVKDNNRFADNLTEFTVTYKGNYVHVSLGDVQRSVFNILKGVMASNHYALADKDLESAGTWIDYLGKKWSFNKNSLICYMSTSYDGINNEKTEEEKRAEEIAKDMAENKATMSATATLDDTTKVEYNQAVPFFGKTFGKDFEKTLGEIKVKVGDQTVKATKIKVVRIKGATATSWNAAIQIIKTEDKKLNKSVKKLTKVDKKNIEKNKLPITIYALNLGSALSGNQISDAEVKGKSGKYSLKFKFAASGKKFTAKQKKDSFGNAYAKFEKNAAGDWIIESGDLKGTISANQIKDKSK